MKLPFINEGIFEPHKSPIEIRESSYIYIYIYIYIYGCPRTKDGSKELQYNWGDVIVHGPEEENSPRKGRNKSVRDRAPGPLFMMCCWAKPM